MQPAFAGPPFFTDDPEPVDYRHWEITSAFQDTVVKSDKAGTTPSFVINHGVWSNVEVGIVPALAFDDSSAGTKHLGYSDTGLSVKYRFINQQENEWWPEAAIAPLLEMPTGNYNKGLSTTGRLREYMPLWLQKDFGSWTTYGGGGYWENTGAGNKNYWFFGWELQRKVTDRLTLGGELFHQTSNTVAGNPAQGGSTGFNLGGAYDLGDTYHLLFSAGQGIQNVASTNRFSCYLALQLTY